MYPLLTRRRIAALVVAASLAVGGCSDGGTSIDAGGDHVATLVAPAGASDGAAVIELTGAGIASVAVIDGQLFTDRNGNTVRVVVVKDEPGTIRFRMTMESGSRLPQATVVEVSDAGDALRASLAGYDIGFSR
jgi:hypothetical protein